MIKILFLAANPIDTDQLRLDEEVRAIDAAMRQGKYRDYFDLRSHWAVRIDDLQELLMRHQPHIVHFSGHGSTKSELLFLDDKGKTIAVPSDALSNLFGLLKDNIRCVVLNACYADGQASSIAHHIDCVVGMSDAISDESALSFAIAFYRALAYGRSVKNAFELGCAQIDLRNLKEQHKPKLLANRVDPSAVIFSVDDALVKRVVHPVAKRMAPKPPADFVPRPKEYDALRELLLADGSTPVGITAAIRGAGGYGKTTLAQALCHDPAIIEHFPDGIFWVELAQEPGELTGRVLNLVENLIDRRPGSTTLDAATGELIKALGNRKLLLVIDDAWQAPHVAPFLQGGPHCTRLITTRINTVLPPDAPRINVDAMQSHEATQLLGTGLSQTGEALDKLAMRLGEWPLLLRIINSVLRQWVGLGASLSQVITDVNQALDEEGFGAFHNSATPDERHASVAATINVSLRLLNERERQFYQQLAIFPEDVDIPLATVAQLWAVSLFAAKMLCTRLADLSLLLRFNLVTNTIRLHDVVHIYLCQSQLNLAALHSTFLDSYKLTNWTTLPSDESYLWDRLAYHLIEAKRTEELTALFADDQWLQVRVAHDGYIYDGYLADLHQSWQQVHTTIQHQIDSGAMPTALALSIHHALIRTSINSLSSNYEPALVVRAVALGLWSSERALSTAYKVVDAQKRVAMLTAILDTYKCNEQQSVSALTLALDVVLAIKDEMSRVEALAALAPHLGEAQVPQVLQVTLAIKHEGHRAGALAALASHLSEVQMSQVLQVTLTIKHEGYRAEALAALASHLSEVQMSQVLQSALAIKDEWSRAVVLAALASYLSEVQVSQVLQTALAIKDERSRARVLAALASHLREAQLPQVLQIALAIKDERYRAEALTALAPHLSEVQMSQVLQIALAIKDERYRAETLAVLAPYLSEAQVSQVLQAVLVIKPVMPRARALAAVAPHLSENQRTSMLPLALQAALSIKDEWSRIEALAALAPHLSETLQTSMLLQVLQAPLGLADEEDHVRVLAALAPHLSEVQMSQVLQASLEIVYEGHRAEALAALAPHLSEVQVSQVLQAALAIKHEGHRARVLVALAPHLSEVQVSQVLQVALIVADERYRARALAILAPHLSEIQQTRVLPLALQAALAIKPVGPRARVLATLAPYMSETQRTRTLLQVLQAALAVKHEGYRARALAALAPHLSEAQMSQVLQAALAIKHKGHRAEALTALAPYMSESERTKMLPLALQAALVVADEKYRARALAALVPYLSESERTKMLPLALQAALAVKHEGYRARALAALTPHLSESQVSQVLQAVLAIVDEGYRAHALAALTPYLNEVQVSQVLQAVLAIMNEGYRAHALAIFLIKLSNFSPLLFSLHKSISDHLWKNLSTWQRQDLLEFLAQGSLLQPPILDQNTLAAIAQSISAICFEWRWL